MNGKGVKVDEKKAKYYWELGAMGGCTGSRYNLGIFERNVGKMSRALIHFIIAIRGGYAAPLEMIKKLYSDGYLPKGAYTVALQAYQEYLSEIKSDQRDKAAAFDDEYRYY